MHIYLNINLIFFQHVFEFKSVLAFAETGIFFLAKKRIKELEKKRTQQNDLFSIVFKKKILP